MKSQPHATAELYCSACERTFDASAGEVCPKDGTRLIRLVTQADPFVGKDLDGRYAMQERIGHGGMGAVYRAVQRSVDRQVAIKVVSPAMMTEPAIIKRFLREARLASRLDHPNVVQVFDFGQTPEGVFYLVMELVAGKTLDAILEEDGALSPDRTVEIGRQVCAALEAAHAVPMVHRDLKPANVIVDMRGHVKVLDFGIAKSLASDTLSATMTRSGAIIGTPAFMAPEIAQGHDFDGRADLYSFGCLLHLMLTGKLPFDAEALPELVRMHVSDPVPPLPSSVPRALAHVVGKLMEKTPARRYPSAAAARVALENSLARSGSRAEMQTTIPERRRSRSAKPKRAWWPFAAAGVVAIGAGITAAIALSGGGAAPAAAPDARVEVAVPPPIVEPIAIDAAVQVAEPATVDAAAEVVAPATTDAGVVVDNGQVDGWIAPKDPALLKKKRDAEKKKLPEKKPPPPKPPVRPPGDDPPPF